jgi:hypothetical protein
MVGAGGVFDVKAPGGHKVQPEKRLRHRMTSGVPSATAQGKRAERVTDDSFRV